MIMLTNVEFGRMLRLRNGSEALMIRYWRRRNRYQIVTDGGIMLFVDADGRENRNVENGYDVIEVL